VDGRQGALTGLYLLCLSALEDSGTLLHLAELRVEQLVTSLVPLSLGLHHVLLIAHLQAPR
jgi:hypothetical protein